MMSEVSVANLQQQRVDGLLLDALLNALHIGHQKIITNDFDTLACKTTNMMRIARNTQHDTHKSYPISQ
jgi:hypothetical protein